MTVDISMPQLGESISEGIISKWLKKPGDRVEKYEPICEVATDKVNAEVPSTYEGTMREILVDEGATVAVDQLICRIQTNDEQVPSVTNQPEPAQKEWLATKEDWQQEESQPRSMKNRYSPAVLRLAQEHQIDLNQIEGTGKRGRITRKDVLTHLSTKPEPFITESQSQEPLLQTRSMEGSSSHTLSFNPSENDREIPLSSVRRTIAGNMVNSKQQIPHAWMMVEVDVTGLVTLRNQIKESFKMREGVPLTFMPFFIKAVVDAIKEFPYVNSVWSEDKIILKKRINISVAVGTEEALYVPVIHDADSYSISGLAKKVAQLAKKTHQDQLELSDTQGGTFTVNNTGSFGSIASQPIINYPQAAILSFESIVKRPVVIDQMIAIRDMINLCISLDHRILDGVMIGKFLQHVKKSLESYHSKTVI